MNAELARMASPMEVLPRQRMALPININDTKSGLSRDQVEILRKCLANSPIADLMAVADRTNRTKFRDQVLKPMLADGLLAMTVPDKPTSSKQRYRTSDKGRNLLASLKEGGA